MSLCTHPKCYLMREHEAHECGCEPCPACAEKDAEIARLRDLIMLPKDREAMLVARATAVEQERDQLLGELCFVKGKDIPATEQAAKAALVLRAHELEAKLEASERREAEKDIEIARLKELVERGNSRVVPPEWSGPKEDF